MCERVKRNSPWAQTISASQLPPIIPPAGLSKERQLYLYNKIREFCWEEWETSFAHVHPSSTAIPITIISIIIAITTSSKEKQLQKKKYITHHIYLSIYLSVYLPTHPFFICHNYIYLSQYHSLYCHQSPIIYLHTIHSYYAYQFTYYVPTGNLDLSSRIYLLIYAKYTQTVVCQHGGGNSTHYTVIINTLIAQAQPRNTIHLNLLCMHAKHLPSKTDPKKYATKRHPPLQPCAFPDVLLLIPIARIPYWFNF